MDKWLKYNLSQKTYSPIPFDDIFNNKRDIVHNEAFERAKRLAIINSKDSDDNPLFLELYDENVEISDTDDVIYVDENFNECDKENSKYYVILNDWKFVESNNSYDEYTNSPTLICTKRNINREINNSKFVRHKISLSPWWNMTYEIDNNAKISAISENLIDEYEFNEIVGYDYIRKKAILENRVENNKRKIPFNHIKYSDTINIDYKNNY